MLKRIMQKVLISGEHQERIDEFAELLQRVISATTLDDVNILIMNVSEFYQKLDDPKRYKNMKDWCNKLVEYLMDTKTHIKTGVHHPEHNNWNVQTTYPDINDYVDFGATLPKF